MKSSVIGIIFDAHKQKVVVLQRRDVPVWVLPGGGIEPNETAEQAIVREIKEETGLQVTIVRQISEYLPINKLALPTYLFECKAVAGALTTGDETEEIAFFPLGALPHGFFHLHKEWLLDALKNEKEIIKRPISNVTYWNLFKYFLKHPSHVVRLALSRLGFPLNRKK